MRCAFRHALRAPACRRSPFLPATRSPLPPSVLKRGLSRQRRRGGGGYDVAGARRNSPSLRQLLLRPALFAGAVCLGSFGAAGVAIDARRRSAPRDWLGRPAYDALLDPPMAGGGRRSSSSRGQETFERKAAVLGPIIGLNAAVLLAWLASARGMGGHALRSVLERHFLHAPLSGRSLPLLLSTFSHSGAAHGALNMYALWGFGGMLLQVMPAEQFVAAYVSAGVLTSLASLGVGVARACTVPSLGASGAVLALVAAGTAAFPAMQLSIVFLPMFAFPAHQALLGLVALDSAGLLLGWKVFDHAAHLGGCLLGYGGYRLGLLDATDGYMKAAAGAWRKLAASGDGGGGGGGGASESL